MSAETLIVHGGDLLSFRIGSGYSNQQLQRIAPDNLKIEFRNTPKALRVYQKRNGIVLWHANSAGASKVISGNTFTEADLAPNIVNTYAIEGSVSDAAGRYLPRVFSFTLGNSTEHEIALYHTPLGARFTHAGGVFGHVVFDNGTPAVWALITLTIKPTLGPAMVFTAQTDAHGEFRLPLDRLPALSINAPSPTYNATLAAKASVTANAATPINPDVLLAIDVARGKNNQGKTQFANTFALKITPGKVVEITSPEHNHIVLKSA